MTQYDNSNQAAIWGNDNRETDKHPHFKGSGEIDGVEYWISAWKRDPEGNPKAPALKLKFQRKDEVQAKGMSEAKQAAQPAGGGDPFGDDIPFAPLRNTNCY